MDPIKLKLIENHGLERKGYLIEQGVPVKAMSKEEVADLRLLSGGKAVPAEVQVESTDAWGNVRWLMVTSALDIPAGETRELFLETAPEKAADVPRLKVEQLESRISVESDTLSLTLQGLGEIDLKYKGKSVISGDLAFSLMHDARSFVAGVRTLHFRPYGFTVEEESESRCLIVWKAKVHPDVYREYSGVDQNRYIDCELEMRVYAASPVIRLKWTLTNQFYYPAALEKYAFALPISKDSKVSGEWMGDKFGHFARVETPNGSFAVTAPFIEDIGKGAGVGIERVEWIYDEEDGFSVEEASPDELPAKGDGTKPAIKLNTAERPPVFRTDYRIAIGGINPPADEGEGTDNPQRHRTFLYGMSRSFESSIILDPTDEAIKAELTPLYFTLDPQHYSDTETLPERGDPVTFGDYALETARSADWLEKNQWRDSLYFGEWWREYCIERRQGIEESGSGNSSLGVYYHYLRTGEERFLASAKRSMQTIFDITMNKQHGGLKLFMHTRRFLFDRENWHHPRYQRIAGMMRPSHFFCDRRMRKKAVEVVRWFAEHFLDTDGAPMSPNTNDINGPKGRCTEAAMAQFCESLILAYHETRDEWFLEKARLMANWAVDQMESSEDLIKWICNWNIQFVLRGLLAVFLTTDEQKFKDAYVKICRGLLQIPPEHAGYKNLTLWEVHFVVYCAWHFPEAQRLTGDTKMVEDFVKILNSELSRQVEDGTFPYVTTFTPRLSQWISYYDPKTVAAYLPVIASRMKVLGLSRGGNS